MTDRRQFLQAAATVAVPAIAGAPVAVGAQAGAAVPSAAQAFSGSVPPGVSPADFNRVLASWRDIVGGEWVFTSPEDVALYRDAYSPFRGEPGERVAAAAVAPSTLEEVQAIVRVANEFRVPIYPVSTGRNLAYGGAAPVYSGSVVLDLKRMNRVLEVSERHAYAIVEPGVSYFDLHTHINRARLNLWIDPPDPGWGSLIGNALDGGSGWTASPFRDHFAAHCGMEVVLADGEVMRTGMGALPDAKTWAQYRWGYGPWVDGLFRQGNLGIVTKMGFHLMPRPQVVQTATVQVPGEQGVIAAMDALNLLENQQVVNGATQLSRSGQGWNLVLPVYGREKIVRAAMECIQDQFAPIQGARVTPGELFRTPLDAETLERVRKVTFGVPDLSTFGSLGSNEDSLAPAGGYMGFSPVIPRSGEAVLEFTGFYREHLHELSEGGALAFIGPVFMTGWERTLMARIIFPLGGDRAMNARMRAAYLRWVQLAAARGWGEHRAPAVFQDDVAHTYSFNNHALTRMREKIKDAVDPNGILAAGRYGVWPRHLRRE